MIGIGSKHFRRMLEDECATTNASSGVETVNPKRLSLQRNQGVLV